MLQWIGSNRKLLLRVVGTIVAVVLIVVLVRGEAWSEVLGALQQLTWTRIAGALALVVLSLCSWRHDGLSAALGT
jgi:uncharacterized membrane protein YbhN (UPF0104 family)